VASRWLGGHALTSPGEIGSVGGKVEVFYYAFGDTDLFIIADVPDNVSAAALSLTVAAACCATMGRPASGLRGQQGS